jgi:hypothetical protein
VANDEVPAKCRAGVSHAMKVVARDLGLARPCRVKWFRPASQEEAAAGRRTTTRQVSGAWDSQNGHIKGIVLV